MLMENKMNITKTHDFNMIFQSIFDSQVRDWNIKHKDGTPLGALDPQLAMISGLIKNSTMSPYVADGWMYGGFSMAADAPYYVDYVPTQKNEAPVLNFLKE